MRRGHQPGAPTFLNVIVPPRVTVLGVNGYAPSAPVALGRPFEPPRSVASPIPAALPWPTLPVLVPPVVVEVSPPVLGECPALPGVPFFSELPQASTPSAPNARARAS